MRPPRISEYRQREIDLEDTKPLTVRCLKCGWHWAGPAVAARQKAVEHRSRRHPEIGPYRQPRRKRLSTFRHAKMTEDEINDVEVERRKRAFLAGIDIDERQDVF